MRVLHLGVFFLAARCALLVASKQISTLPLLSVSRQVRVQKGIVDFYFSFRSLKPKPTVEVLMTENYCRSLGIDRITAPGKIEEPRQQDVRGLVKAFTKGTFVYVTFNLTDFLSFRTGDKISPYKPIVLIGFPDTRYFVITLNVEFPLNDKRIKDTLWNNEIVMVLGDAIVFDEKNPKSAANKMGFSIPKIFEETADRARQDRVFMTLLVMNGCNQFTLAYYNYALDNTLQFWKSRSADSAFGRIIDMEENFYFSNKTHETCIMWMQNNRCGSNAGTFPEGILLFRRKALFSSKSSIVEEMTMVTFLKMGLQGNPRGFPNTQYYIWEETTLENVKTCSYFLEDCEINCRFIAAYIQQVSFGMCNSSLPGNETCVELHQEKSRTFDHYRMNIRYRLTDRMYTVALPENYYYCRMLIGVPGTRPFLSNIKFSVVFP